MNYQKIYDQIVNRAKIETKQRIVRKKAGEYFEGHHIIPKCLGGTGWQSNYNHPNIVILTAREHFLCHWLLHEIHKNDYRLAKAFYAMVAIKGKKQVRYIPSSRIVEYAKVQSSKLHSIYMKEVFWTEEMRKKMSESHTGKKHSKETLEKLKTRINQYFTSLSEEERLKKSKRIIGDKNPSKRSDVKKKMSEAAKKRAIIKCLHCNKTGPINQMKQWHFNNCKYKKDESSI